MSRSVHPASLYKILSSHDESAFTFIPSAEAIGFLLECTNRFQEMVLMTAP